MAIDQVTFGNGIGSAAASEASIFSQMSALDPNSPTYTQDFLKLQRSDAFATQKIQGLTQLAQADDTSTKSGARSVGQSATQ
jgi:hypothetical protein